MSHITLSFGRDSDGRGTSGDLSALGIGLAVFIAWVFSAPLGMASMLSHSSGPLMPIPEETAFIMSFVYICFLALCLLWMGLTNQYFLRFYVGRNVLLIAGLLCLAGTIAATVCGMVGGGCIVLGCVGSALMGIGSGVLAALWCTAFARYEFSTITLNAALGIVAGIICAVALINWIPPIVSVVIVAVFAFGDAIILWHMTPIPYYRRREMPIFHALRVSRLRFGVQLGIPVIFFGVALGVMGSMCVRHAFCSDDIACNLLVGAACALCAVIFIAAVGLLKNEAHWDTLFRFMLPLVGVGMVGVPLLDSSFELYATFLLALGVSVMLALLWVLFSDMAQEFRLSPIFVLGIGGGLLTMGVIIGCIITPHPAVWSEWGGVHWTGLAMVAMVCLMVGGAFMPRKRNVLRMLAADKVEDATGLNQMILDSAAAHGTATTDEQADAAKRDTVEEKKTASENAEEVHEDAPAHSSTGPVPDANESETPSVENGNEEQDATQHQKGSFYKRCEQIADQFLLSRRETEVLFLLAKGHKAGFIEDKLCISRSTAKTHINHIYKKMDIHTQQELLNMVEDRPRPSGMNDPSAIPRHHGF